MASYPIFTIAILILALASPLISAVDLTLVSKTHGVDVVEAAVTKVKLSQIFPDDHSLLTRLALIESQLGDDAATFPPNFYGGIWQLSESQYLSTKDVTSYPFLADYHSKIASSFNINWPSTRWTDLLKPMHSILAAHLYVAIILNGQPTIPDLLYDQATLWFNSYTNNRLGTGNNQHQRDAVTIDEFVSEVQSWEESRRCSNAKIKVVVVMDESGSIGIDDYNKALNFSANFLTAYNLTKAHVGFLTFSTDPRIIFELDNNLSRDEIGRAILNAGYIGGNTGTGDAILEAVQMFLRSSVVAGVPLIMVTFTDGQSNIGFPVADGVGEAMALGVDSYAVGITTSINYPELLEIAYGDANKVEVLTQYDALTDFFHQLNQITCKAEQTPDFDVTSDDDLLKGEKRFYKFEVPAGAVGDLNVNVEIGAGDVLGYYSYKYKNPSAALYDGVLFEGDNSIAAPPAGGPVHLTVEGMGEEDENLYTLTATLD